MVSSTKIKKQQVKKLTNELAPQKKRAALTAPFILLGVILVVLLGISGYAFAMRDVIVAGVTVQNIDIGGLHKADAVQKLNNVLANYSGSGKHTVHIETSSVWPTTQQLGVSFDVQKSVDAAWNVGRTKTLGAWFVQPFAHHNDVRLYASMRNRALTNYFDGLVRAYSRPVVEPSLHNDHGTITTIPGESGQEVAKGDYEKQILYDVLHLLPVELTLTTTTLAPKLAEQDLAEAQGIMETMMSAPLTLTSPKKNFVVSKEQLASWVTFSYDRSKVTVDPKQGIIIGFDQQKVRDYLSSLNEQVGIPAKSTHGYDADVLGEYAYKNFEGKEISLDDTLTQMQIAAQETTHRSADLVIGPSLPQIEKKTAIAPKPQGKVISVDVGTQELFAFEDGRLVFWTHVSTGIPGKETPLGEYKIYNKTPKQWMIGQGYAIPNVTWVMAYKGDYTLHTAYWHTKFGKVMSHGCTNMSEADAHWLYNWSSVGTPVMNYDSTKSS